MNSIKLSYLGSCENQFLFDRFHAPLAISPILIRIGSQRMVRAISSIGSVMVALNKALVIVGQQHALIISSTSSINPSESQR